MQSDNREFDRMKASLPLLWYGLTLNNLKDRMLRRA